MSEGVEMTRLDRFLANPPRRLAAAIARKKRSKRQYRADWMPTLLKRQEGKCFYCQRQIAAGKKEARGGVMPATFDHVKPVSQQGYNKLANLVAACSPCNSRKSDMSVGQFKKLLAKPA